MTDNRLLDIRIAKEVMGKPVVGFSCAIFVEGSWSVHPESSPDKWTCDASIQPVTPGFFCHCAEESPPEPQAPRLSDDVEGRRVLAEWDKQRLEEWHADRARFQGHVRYCLEVVPFYSTEMNETMKVVEKLHEDPSFGVHAFHLRTMRAGVRGWFASFLRPSSPVMSNSVEHLAEGFSAEEAICLAALKVFPKWT